MEILDQYKDLKDQVFNYFGCLSALEKWVDWESILIHDLRQMYWALTYMDSEIIFYTKPLTKEIVENGSYYVCTVVYIPTFKTVFRKTDHTLIYVFDYDLDPVSFMVIFDNVKEQKNAVNWNGHWAKYKNYGVV